MNQNECSKVTIDQVAAECGVSKTTVSRFLNGRFGNMSAETKERIEQAIARLNYRPNRSAQRLKASNSRLIGCVIADIGSPFSGLLLKGIAHSCEEAGYQVLFSESGGSAEREKRIIEGFLENRVDGLIINTCGSNDAYLHTLRLRRIPVVLADRELHSPGVFDTVTGTNHQSAYEATNFLLSQGYSSVAFFSESVSNISPRFLRREGYCDAIENFGNHKTEIIEFPPNDLDVCVECLDKFVQSHKGKRVAILTSNGTSAQMVIRSANILGLEIGFWLGLCTFDDWDWLRLAMPPVTSIAFSAERIGEESADLLLQRISQDEKNDIDAKYLTISGKLIVRQSTPGKRY